MILFGPSSFGRFLLFNREGIVPLQNSSGPHLSTIVRFFSDEPETWRNKFQRTFDNQWKYLSDGCSCSCETWTFLDNAGFSNVHYQKFYLNELMVIAYLMRPHIAGYAVK